MADKHRPIPQMHSETEERAYWESHDSIDHVDWGRAKHVRMPHLKRAGDNGGGKPVDNGSERDKE